MTLIQGFDTCYLLFLLLSSVAYEGGCAGGIEGGNTTIAVRTKRETGEEIQKRIEDSYSTKSTICTGLSITSATLELSASGLDIAKEVGEATPLIGNMVGAVPAIGAATLRTAKAGLELASVVADCDSVPFDEIKDIMRERFDTADRKLDQNYKAIQDLTMEVREGFTKIETSLTKTYLTVLLVSDKVDGLKRMIVNSKITDLLTVLKTSVNSFKDLRHSLNSVRPEVYGSRIKDIQSKLEYLNPYESDDIKGYQMAMRQILAHKLALHEAGGEASLTVLDLLYLGTQHYVSMVHFMLEQYSYLCQHFLENENVDEFNVCVRNTYNHFYGHKKFLVSTESIRDVTLIEEVVASLRNVQQLEALERDDLKFYQSITEKIDYLIDIKEQIEAMELPEIKRAKISGVLVRFAKSKRNRNVPKTVQYSIQYRSKSNSQYFPVSHWSRPFPIQGNYAVVSLPLRKEPGYDRIVYRRFDQGRPQKVAVITSEEITKFQDSTRDVYDSVRNGMEYFWPKGSQCHLNFDKGWTILHAAAYSGSVDSAKQFLESCTDININTKDSQGNTPLHVACQYGRIEMVKHLLTDLRATVTAQNHRGRTPLHVAAAEGFVDVTEELLKANVFNPRDNANLTPMFYSLMHPEVLELFLNYEGVDVEAKTLSGMSALHMAVLTNNTGAVDKLLKKPNINVNSVDITFSTPLHYAIINGREDVVSSLLNHESIDTGLGNLSPLHFAVSLGRDGILRLLLSRSADVSVRGEDGITPLHSAAMYGRLDMAKQLLDKGADMKARTQTTGMTPLHLAIAYKKEELAWMLIDRGASITDVIDNKSPFMLACEKGLVKTAAKIFLKMNDETLSIAELTRVDKEQNTALHLAASNGRANIVQLLLQTFAKHSKVKWGEIGFEFPSFTNWNTPVHQKLSLDTLLDKANLLKPANEISGQYRNFADYVNKKNQDGRTALHLASSVDINTVKFILAYYKESVKSEGNLSRSPLHEASSSNQLEIVQHLLSAGALPNAVDSEGSTPLHLASSKGHIEIVRALLKDENEIIGFIDKCDKQDRTALYMAKNLEILTTLIQRKAKAESGLSPVWNCRNLEVLKYLETNTSLSLNVEDDRGRSLLYKCSSVKAVRYLVETKLMFSYIEDEVVEQACCENLELVKYYVERLRKNVNPDSNGKENVFLMKALNCERLDIVEYLLRKGAKFVKESDNKWESVLCSTVRTGTARALRYMLKTGMKPEVQCEGVSILHLAASFGRSEVVEFLLDYMKKSGIDYLNEINRLSQQVSYTPLMDAVNKGHYEVARLLLDNGADPNVLKSDGETAIFKTYDLQMLALLVNRGANVNYRFDLHGQSRTPLLDALFGKPCLNARYLVAVGARLSSGERALAQTSSCEVKDNYFER